MIDDHFFISCSQHGTIGMFMRPRIVILTEHVVAMAICWRLAKQDRHERPALDVVRNVDARGLQQGGGDIDQFH